MRSLDGREHGKRSTYQLGCPCDQCREANRDYKRQRAALRVRPDDDTTARLVLAVVQEVARHYGVNPQSQSRYPQANH